MKLNFKIYQLKPDSCSYKDLVIKNKEPNEFIIVGEEKLGESYDCYKVQQLCKKGLQLIGGLKFDIPKEQLTLDIVDNIIKLNS